MADKHAFLPHENYAVTLKGDGFEDTILVKTSLPQSKAGLAAIIAFDGTYGPTAKDVHGLMTNIEHLSLTEAEHAYGSAMYTVRRRSPAGDYFVKPNGSYEIMVDMDGKAIRLFVPFTAVDDDCDGNAARRLLRDAAAVALGKRPQDVTWDDVIHVKNSDLDDFGVHLLPTGCLLAIDAASTDPVLPEDSYETSVIIPENVPAFRKTVSFPDGMRMDVALENHDKTTMATSALLRPDGPIAYQSPPDYGFDGTWTIDYNGITYAVTAQYEVKPKNDARPAASPAEAALRSIASEIANACGEIAAARFLLYHGIDRPGIISLMGFDTDAVDEASSTMDDYEPPSYGM